MRFVSCALLLALLAADASAVDGVQGRDYDLFKIDGLQCILGNNAGLNSHAPQYNGVYSITAPECAASPFVEAYAGLNLEHYFDGRPRPADRTVFFEPRTAPMDFLRLGADAAELHQPTSPVFAVESWTRFRLKPPYALDMDFRCIPRKDVFQGGFFGVFWASYIRAPEDKSIYFLGAGATLDAPVWVQLCTQKHGAESSVWADDDAAETPFEQPGDLLYANPSPLRYGERFFYGRVGNDVLIYMFAPGTIIRFAHSPSGGGKTAQGDALNPAWDFQWIVPGYTIDQEYKMRMRLVLKPWAGRADVLAEVRKYWNQLSNLDTL